jgi:hypothetical protein
MVGMKAKVDKAKFAELDKDLESALQSTFPASDPITVGDATSHTPDRPAHRRPAEIDKDLVDRLAREVESKHGAA